MILQKLTAVGTDGSRVMLWFDDGTKMRVAARIITEQGLYAGKALSEEELKKFALSYFAKNGQRITEQAMELFLDRSGDDMGHLVTEMEKLSAYAAGRDIRPEDVLAITSVTAQNRVFEMLDCMLRRQPQAALERYAELTALREPPMRILYLMTQQMNRLLQVKEMDKAGFRQDGIAQNLWKLRTMLQLKLVMIWICKKNWRDYQRSTGRHWSCIISLAFRL